MTEPASASRLQLIDNLDLKAAAPLRAEILALCHMPLDIDASNVQRLGGLCLQVLMSAQATWAADAIPFAISSPSPAFQEALSLFGAEDLQPFVQQG
jgi:chemotaxis protein CheX